MNYYVDTEFLEGPQKTWWGGKTKPTIDLISIALVADDELKELYCREVIARADQIFIGSNFNPKEDEYILSEFFNVKKEVNENGRGILYS